MASDPLHWKCDSLLFDPHSPVAAGGGDVWEEKEKRRREDRQKDQEKERMIY